MSAEQVGSHYSHGKRVETTGFEDIFDPAITTIINQGLNLKEASYYYGATAKAIKRLIKSGRIPAARIPGSKKPQWRIYPEGLPEELQEFKYHNSESLLDEISDAFIDIAAEEAKENEVIAEVDRLVPALSADFYSFESQIRALLLEVMEIKEEASHKMPLLEQKVKSLEETVENLSYEKGYLENRLSIAESAIEQAAKPKVPAFSWGLLWAPTILIFLLAILGYCYRSWILPNSSSPEHGINIIRHPT